MSRIIDYTDRSTCILFGDGAGAMLVEPAEEGETGFIDFVNQNRRLRRRLLEAARRRQPHSPPAPSPSRIVSTTSSRTASRFSNMRSAKWRNAAVIFWTAII